MKIFTLLVLLLVATFGALADEVLETDLAPLAQPDFDGFYLASAFKMPTSKQVYIEDVPVSFSDGWMRDYRSKTSTRYQERIKEKYGKTMKAQLALKLEAAGWTVQTEKSKATLILSPMITGLNIYAPNEPGIRQVIVRNAGHAVLEFTFKTPDGKPFMKIVDRRTTRENIGSPIVANMASNYRYFKILMQNWSEKSVIYLDNILKLVKEQADSNS